MALVVEYATDSDTFVIGRALGGTDGLVIELERVIPTGESVVPYYWVWGDDLDVYEENLTSEPGIEEVDAIVRSDQGVLYRIDWHGETSATIHGLFDLEFTLLRGTCTTEGWEFEIRFPSSEAASRFQRYLTERSIPHTLERVNQLADAPAEAGSRLTRDQHEALVAAYRSGYFDEPRESSLRELADELGISPSSVAGRLRRGHAALIEEHLVDESGGRRGRSVRPTAGGG